MNTFILLRKPASYYNASMIRAGTAYSKSKDPLKAAVDAAQQALAKAGLDHCRTVFLMATAEHRRHYPQMAQEVRRITRADHLIGTGAYGVLTESAELEKQHGVAVLVLHSDEIECSSFSVTDLQENNFKAGEKAAALLAKSGFYPSSLMLFADPFSFQNHVFFDGFESISHYLPILGGLSSENGKEEKTFQFSGSRVGFDSVSAFAMGGKIRTETGLARSCHPFGDPMRITRAEGNLIYEMEGRPAYDMLLESISQVPISDTEQILHQVFLGIPVRSFQTDFTNSPYLIRNIMGINPKKGLLTCIAPIEEGEFVTFAFQDPEFAKQNLREMLEELRFRMLPNKPAFGFYFNSCARGRNLYKQPDVDTQMIREFFPEVPVIGFSSYGELAPVDFVNHLHHYSGVLTLVAET